MSTQLIFLLADIYSRELFEYFKEKFPQEIKLVPVDLNKPFMHALHGDALLYVPSVLGKEQGIFKQVPQIKRIAFLDLFHFDFKDFEASFKKFPPFQVFSPHSLKDVGLTVTLIESFQKEMIRDKNLVLNDQPGTRLCFISQPLMEERSQLGFNQHDLIKTLNDVLGVSFKIKAHPRESREHFQNLNLIFEGSPEDTIKTFSHFIGYNSALLYSAEALGLPVMRINSPSEVCQGKISMFLKQGRVIQKTSQPAIHNLIQFLGKLS